MIAPPDIDEAHIDSSFEHLETDDDPSELVDDHGETDDKCIETDVESDAESDVESDVESNERGNGAAHRTYWENQLRRYVHYATPVLAIMLLLASMGGRWRVASASPELLANARPAKARPAATKSTGASPPSSSSSAANVPLDDEGDERPTKKSAKDLTGKINLNTASEDELMRLPTVGPAKAERIVVWRKKNGGFRRIADIRRVKGFGYKTFKKLEPFLDVKGETTLR